MISMNSLTSVSNSTVWAFADSDIEADDEALLQIERAKSGVNPDAILVHSLSNQAKIDALAKWLRQRCADVPRVIELSLESDVEGIDYSPLLTSQTLFIGPLTSFVRMGWVKPSDMSSINDEEWRSDLPCHLFIIDTERARGGCDFLILKAPEHCSPAYSRQAFSFISRDFHANSFQQGFGKAIALLIADKWTLPDAIILAKASLNAAFDNEGSQIGDLLTARVENIATAYRHFPQVSPLSNPSSHCLESAFTALKHPLDIYPVVDSLELIESLLNAGCKTLQLRIKKIPPGEIESIIQKAIALGWKYQAQLFINDHWQLAVKHHAFGVHLGQEDLLVADVKLIHESGLALGISSHSYFEALIALEYQPSYLALGHIFPTTTKDMPSKPQGLNRLAHYAATFSPVLPTVAIGGIDAKNLSAIKQTGVACAAVVRAVTESASPADAFNVLQNLWHSPLKGERNVA